MQGIFENKFLNEKSVLISSQNVSKKLSRYKKYSAR